MGRPPTVAVAFLRVLADSAGVLSTADIARQVPGRIPSDCWSVLRNQERRGRVERVGHTCRGVPDRWEITVAGLTWLNHQPEAM